MISSVLRISVIAAFVLTAATSTRVHAATCTVQGTITTSPMDTYYCDSNWLSCSGWNEVDLDGTKPLRNIWVGLGTPGNGLQYLTSTDANGHYAMTMSGLPSCTAEYDWYVILTRPGSGTNAPIFRIVDENGYLVSALGHVTLTGATTTFSYTYGRPYTPDMIHRALTVYYTIDSALTEMRSWSTNLATRLGGGSPSQTITVKFYPGQEHNNTVELPWGAMLGYSRFAWGANTRHELGHMVHMAAHHQNLTNWWDSCVSMRFNAPGTDPSVDSHGEESCEYASLATWEGLASFFAVRSLVETETAAENRAFFCFGACATSSAGSSNQDFCSEAAVSSLDIDRNQTYYPCGAANSFGWFTGVGDNFSASQYNCVRVRKDQRCNCPDTNPADGECDWSFYGDNWFVENGFRNEANTYRFFWDMIDSGNEGGFDDTDMTINSFITGMQNMFCATTSGGIDGTCNEPSSSPCIPSSDWAIPGTHVSGDRDSYNVHDLSEHAGFPGMQQTEREINCVHNAPDIDYP